MSILVTGGSGLIGSRICRDIVRQKNEDVVCFDIHMDQEMIDYVMSDEDKKHIVFAEGNILDYENLLELCKANNVTKIVHTASMMGNAKDPILATHVNTGGMIRVLEAARTLGLKKIVYTSTNSIYNTKNPGFLPNDAPYDPDTLYGCTKAFNEYVANFYYNKYGVDVTGIRVSALVFGPLQRRGVSHDIAEETLYKPAMGQPGHCKYNDFGSWVYVDDVSKAHLLALDLKRRIYMQGAYNVKGTVVDFPEMGAFVKKFVPGAQITYDDAKFDQVYVNCDTSITENELGYTPDWNVWDAFKFTINETLKLNGFKGLD